MSLRAVISFLLCLAVAYSFSQPNYGYKLNYSKYICLKGQAVLEILDLAANDTVHVSWSSGAVDTYEVDELEEGMHFVNIKIKHHQDTLVMLKDTTFNFFIEKELCKVTVDKYFSPNDDNYHDRLGVSNTQFHPNFELNIFNKWGQRVYSQRKDYIPWDGKWNGIDLPDGTYYYIFFYDSDNKSKNEKGDITILR